MRRFMILVAFLIASFSAIASEPIDTGTAPVEITVVASQLVNDLISLQQAAENHDPKAEFELGHRYLLGDGVTQSTLTAIRWYKKVLIDGLGTRYADDAIFNLPLMSRQYADETRFTHYATVMKQQSTIVAEVQRSKDIPVTKPTIVASNPPIVTSETRIEPVQLASLQGPIVVTADKANLIVTESNITKIDLAPPVEKTAAIPAQHPSQPTTFSLNKHHKTRNHHYHHVKHHRTTKHIKSYECHPPHS